MEAEQDVLEFVCLAALTLFVFSLLARQHPKPARAAVAVLALAVLAAGMFMGAFQYPNERSGGNWLDKPAVGQTILFIFMMTGMMCKNLFDLIERRKDRLKEGFSNSKKPGLDFDFWNFVQPLLVASIVFGAVLGADLHLGLPGLLLSFQNGFFWQSILAKRATNS